MVTNWLAHGLVGEFLELTFCGISLGLWLIIFRGVSLRFIVLRSVGLWLVVLLRRISFLCVLGFVVLLGVLAWCLVVFLGVSIVVGLITRL